MDQQIVEVGKKNGETREQTEARLKNYYTGRQTLRFRVANAHFPRYLIADLGPFQVRPASINYRIPAGEAVECTVRLSRNRGRKQLIADPIERRYIRARAIEMTVPVFKSDDGTWFAQEPETGKRVMFFDQDAGQTGNLWLVTGRENDTWIAGSLVQLQTAASDRQIQLEPMAEEDEPTFADPADLVRRMMGHPPQYSYLGKPGQTPAQILGIVSHFALEADIKAAYRRQIRNAHPDNGGSNEEFAVLNRATAWITLLKALTGGELLDLGSVLGITDQMALVGTGETTDANGTNIAGSDMAPILSPAEQRIHGLVSFFRHEAEEQSKVKRGKKGNAPKPVAETPAAAPVAEVTAPTPTPAAPAAEPIAPLTAPSSMASQVIDLESWNREALREAAKCLGITQGKTGDKRKLLPLIAEFLELHPEEVEFMHTLQSKRVAAAAATDTTPSE